mmetsp:Transcript_155822/g.478360  ORF Transcript_155822/g.478360 Transcript_155822/m.478360 type:complete len:210 (+) Transcript_155822:75-704(+)
MWPLPLVPGGRDQGTKEGQEDDHAHGPRDTQGGGWRGVGGGWRGVGAGPRVEQCVPGGPRALRPGVHHGAGIRPGLHDGRPLLRAGAGAVFEAGLSARRGACHQVLQRTCSAATPRPREQPPGKRKERRVSAPRLRRLPPMRVVLEVGGMPEWRQLLLLPRVPGGSCEGAQEVQAGHAADGARHPEGRRHPRARARVRPRLLRVPLGWG